MASPCTLCAGTLRVGLPARRRRVRTRRAILVTISRNKIKKKKIFVWNKRIECKRLSRFFSVLICEMVNALGPRHDIFFFPSCVDAKRDSHLQPSLINVLRM